jgi:hypothetical protein
MSNSPNPSNQFIGAWELVSGSYVDENNSVINYEEAEVKSLKVLSKNRFSFVTTSKGAFYAAASGEYHVENGIYAEIPAYASYPSMLGQRYEFQYQLEGDTWTNSRWKDGVRVEHEVWKKVE